MRDFQSSNTYDLSISNVYLKQTLDLEKIILLTDLHLFTC